MADTPQVQIPSAPLEPLTHDRDSHGQVLVFGLAGDTTPPTIGNFEPSPGTPLQRNTAVSFDVLDNVPSLLRVEVTVTLGGDRFVVHDGDTFVGQYVNLSTRAPIAGGFRFNVRRNGGWVEPPTFRVHAVDTSGNEAI